MKIPNFRDPNDFQLTQADMEVNNLPSETLPEDDWSLSELLAFAETGQPIPVRQGSYLSDNLSGSDYDHDLPDISRLKDPVDIEQARELVSQNVQRIKTLREDAFEERKEAVNAVKQPTESERAAADSKA
jgi:hypothetical protein